MNRRTEKQTMKDSSPHAHLGRPTVPIQLGQETRHLLVTFEALLLLEEKTGKSVLLGGVFDELKANEVKLMTWGALKWQNPDLSLKEVGRWIHPNNLPEVLNKVTEAWSKGIGVEDQAHTFRPLEISPEVLAKAKERAAKAA